MNKSELILDFYTIDSAAKALNVDTGDIKHLLQKGTIRACVLFDDYSSEEPPLVFFNNRFDFESLPDETKLEMLSCSGDSPTWCDEADDFLDSISTSENEENERGFELSYFDEQPYIRFPELSRLASTSESKANVQYLDKSDEHSTYITGIFSGLWQIKSLSMVKGLLKGNQQTIGVQFVPVIENALYYSTAMQDLPFIYDGFICEVTTSDIRLLREDVERIRLALTSGSTIQPLNGEPWEIKSSRVRPPSVQAISVIRQLIESNSQLGTSILDHPTKAKEKIDQYLARQGLPPLKVGDSTFSNWLIHTR
ncbi:hypothetical protein L4C39_14670 [Vibrio clamense]|uniref:hypothetical protein n=1 Tax=Vibrio clamense TaxID=2910254 RepID=UPI003D1F94A5